MKTASAVFIRGACAFLDSSAFHTKKRHVPALPGKDRNTFDLLL